MQIATNYINNGAKLICTNLDKLSTSTGIPQPDTLATVKYLECATGKKALNVGKPNTYWLEIIKK